jgi:NAD(P)-dependent dehydrogenase (short-subunit alcohol dehydrogenase family)
MELEARTAVVTGAASGIGRALTLALHSLGARLVVADRATDAIHRLAAEVNGQAVLMDVASAEDNDRLATVAGPPTLLCLNAGVISTTTGAPWEAPPEEWHRVLGVNLGGVVNGLRAFVPTMLGDGERHHILITASLAGLATWPGGGPYAASKHAVVTVAEQAAIALAGEPVSVTVLCPALVRSGMSEHGADPNEVATTALDAIERGCFIVTPAEWSEVSVDRARRLAAGQRPRIPAPKSDPRQAQVPRRSAALSVASATLLE